MKHTKPEVMSAGTAMQTIHGSLKESDAFENVTHRFLESISAYEADE